MFSCLWFIFQTHVLDLGQWLTIWLEHIHSMNAWFIQKKLLYSNYQVIASGLFIPQLEVTKETFQRVTSRTTWHLFQHPDNLWHVINHDQPGFSRQGTVYLVYTETVPHEFGGRGEQKASFFLFAAKSWYLQWWNLMMHSDLFTPIVHPFALSGSSSRCKIVGRYHI